MKQFAQFAKYFQGFCTLLLIAVLPFPYQAGFRIIVGCFYGAFLLDYFVNKRYLLHSFRWQENLPYLCTLFLYLLTFLFIPWEQDMSNWTEIVEVRYALGAISVIGLMGFYPQVKKKYIAITLVTIAAGSIVFVLTTVFLTKDYEGVSLIETFNNVRSNYLVPHMRYNLYLNTAILACVWLIKDSSNWFERISCIILGIIFYIVILISEGRVGIIGTVFVFLNATLFFIPRRHLKFLYLTIAVVLIGGIFAVMNEEKMQHMVNSEEKEIRYYIYQESIDLVKEEPFFGYGASTAREILAEAYLNNENIQKDTEFISYVQIPSKLAAHAHNSLLQAWLEFGLLGLLAMLVLLGFPSIYLLWRKHYLELGVWLCIVIQLQTETIRGALEFTPFCIYLLMILSIHQALDKDSKKEPNSNQWSFHSPRSSRANHSLA